MGLLALRCQSWGTEIDAGLRLDSKALSDTAAAAAEATEALEWREQLRLNCWLEEKKKKMSPKPAGISAQFTKGMKEGVPL